MIKIYLDKITLYGQAAFTESELTIQKKNLSELLSTLSEVVSEIISLKNKEEISTIFLTKLSEIRLKDQFNKSLIQTILHFERRKFLKELRTFATQLYTLWKISDFNPSKSNNDNFDFGKFGINEVKFPFTPVNNPNTSKLPIWYFKCGSMGISGFYELGGHTCPFSFDVGLNKIQLLSGTPIFDENEEIIDIEYDIPAKPEFDIFCPILIVGQDTNKIHTFCKKNEDNFITPLPAFFLKPLLNEKFFEDILSEMQIEECCINQSKPLTMYESLSYLSRASVFNYFYETTVFDHRADTTILKLGSDIDSGNLNALCKTYKSQYLDAMTQKPRGLKSLIKRKFIKEPVAVPLANFVIMLENLSFNFYGMYSLVAFSREIKSLKKTADEN